MMGSPSGHNSKGAALPATAEVCLRNGIRFEIADRLGPQSNRTRKTAPSGVVVSAGVAPVEVVSGVADSVAERVASAEPAAAWVEQGGPSAGPALLVRVRTLPSSSEGCGIST